MIHNHQINENDYITSLDDIRRELDNARTFHEIDFIVERFTKFYYEMMNEEPPYHEHEHARQRGIKRNIAPLGPIHHVINPIKVEDLLLPNKRAVDLEKSKNY